MTAKYRALLTEQGKTLLANAAATGQKLEITHMAVGDGGGSPTQPDESQTKLVNEKRRAALNSLQIDTGNSNQVIAEQVIPEDVGGWWIRELGLYDKNGVLVAIANTPDTYKPQLTEGAGRTQVVRMVLLVKGDANATIVADKTALLVSRDMLNAAIDEHARSRNHPDATLLAKGFTQLSNDSNSASETQAATPKAVKTVSDASLKIAANLKDLPNKSIARRNLELGTAATCNVGTQASQLMEVGAFGLGSGPKHREETISNLGEIYRVTSASKNAPGGGVYGVLNLPIDGGPSSGYLAVQTNGSSYVGTSTTPDKPLNWYRIYTTGFKPTAADVGAYSKAEADGKFVKQSGDTITGSLTVNGSIETKSGLTTPYATVMGSLTTKGGVELFGTSPYIDFHYGNTNADYDVRIINDSQGQLSLGAKNVRANENLTVGLDAHVDRTLYINGQDFITKKGVITETSGNRNTQGLHIQGAGNQYVDHYFYEEIGKRAFGAMHVSSGGSDGWFQFGHQGDIRSNGPWPRLMLGEATYFNDGNINGSIWGGYLSNYLNQNFVRDVRLGNVESIATWRGPGYSDSAGYVLTGAANNNVDEYIDVIFRRPLQKHIGGNWVTVWSV
ncbi:MULTISPECIES: phage tail protein [Serratia]|uniref:Phage tail protein n=2 Tax=Serratia marcescens TaxID=615 RepID=A0ABD5BS54_SERMA|nr:MULTISPECIES: phage tail protein [Serratia]MDB6451823.1 phage tail protein [Serratia sp. 21NM0010]MDE5234827.1 phage tail protein [Serratia marcescens]MDE5258484.1 phage tail protein [Serratia marcescens]MDP8598642.1 phage tail protein [Serratia marcescens]MDP8618833.1 phage tail protein [Serratia marcescens]